MAADILNHLSVMLCCCGSFRVDSPLLALLAVWALFICLSITPMNRAKTVQDIEIGFALHEVSGLSVRSKHTGRQFRGSLQGRM